MRPIRFSLSSLFFQTAIAGILLGWHYDHKRQSTEYQALSTQHQQNLAVSQQLVKSVTEFISTALGTIERNKQLYTVSVEDASTLELVQEALYNSRGTIGFLAGELVHQLDELKDMEGSIK